MYTIAALYNFARLDDPEALKPPLMDLCRAQGITGSLLLAREGVNGTIAGPSAAAVETVLAHLRSLPGCAALEHKISHSEVPPFGKMKVRLKREIVTMGQPDVDPLAGTGHYVDPSDWNALIARDDVAVIDTRNDYEVEIGTFRGAIDPKTESFGEFPAWWEANKERFHNKKIAMFCTGGIRCEKSTNYLLGQGVEDVYHLKGGILKYLEEVPATQSTWEGACFVFDNRVSVEHGLKPGPHQLCHGCRRPILPADTQRPEYEAGSAATTALARPRKRTRTAFASGKNRCGSPRRVNGDQAASGTERGLLREISQSTIARFSRFQRMPFTKASV
ncbi:rhodanese-related sulfurtransferase [Sulfitobacter albidus]|uniref:oxygen-dependent tRNA uridine(34) hydroxylase TrhO n=1 Tax=Sulfitobacter albidus TaxID=2829501 RepID=UPI0020C88A36|nr:rhodanese-related sulfurtransferase [Sulfitobacter albidus]